MVSSRPGLASRFLDVLFYSCRLGAVMSEAALLATQRAYSGPVKYHPVAVGSCYGAAMVTLAS